MTNRPDDASFMAAAVALARRGLGSVWPNPAVGCVIVRNGVVVGRGWTQNGGRPHAEAEALRRAGSRAEGATAYVSLEPCAHHGKTPPCADALIDAKVRRVVVAAGDPDQRVGGKGIATLRAAGIEVETGFLESVAIEVNAGFFRRVGSGRPLVTLKLATTLDGRIATSRGESRWITGDDARAHAHRLRAEADAIMIGVGTAMADDPHLTCRLSGRETEDPIRIVLDSRLSLPLTHALVATSRRTPTWFVCLDSVARDRRQAFIDAGADVIAVPPGPDGRADLGAALLGLGGRGLTRVLAEGGAGLAAGLFRADLVDRLVWFHSPAVLGGDGVAAALAFGVGPLSSMPRFERTSVEAVGPDLLETYRRAG